MLDAAALGILLRTAEQDLFRLETRDLYHVGSQDGDYGRYHAGEAAPDPARKAVWHDRLRAERARGLYRRHVHAVIEPLTPYLLFQFDWGHRLNAGVEDIRVLDAAQLTAGLLPGDFYLIDGRRAVEMHYSETGEFTGATIAPRSELPRYHAAAVAAWYAAVPFAEWWANRPQYHRRIAA